MPKPSDVTAGTPATAAQHNALIAYAEEVENAVPASINDLDGPAVTGPLDLDGNTIVNVLAMALQTDPTSTVHAARKGWVDDQLAALKLNTLAAPDGPVSFSNQKGTNVAAGTNPGDLVNKSQLDAAASGVVYLNPSPAAASVANVDVLSAPTAVDGVTLFNGDLVLLKDQTTGSENDVWLFNGAGSAMTRQNVADGVFAFVPNGTTLAGTSWQYDAVGDTWNQVGGGTAYGAGTGLVLNGTNFELDPTLSINDLDGALVTGPLDMNNNTIVSVTRIGLSDQPTAINHVTRKDYVDAADAAAQAAAEATAAAALAASSLNNFDGTAVTGPVDVNNQRIVNVADPTFPQNAATMAYTDMRAATFKTVDAKTAAYTLAAGDVGKLITTDSDVTIPDDTTVIPIGSQVAILATAGTPNVLDEAGVTLNGEVAGAASLAMVLHQIVVATKIAADTWNVSGV